MARKGGFLDALTSMIPGMGKKEDAKPYTSLPSVATEPTPTGGRRRRGGKTRKAGRKSRKTQRRRA